MGDTVGNRVGEEVGAKVGNVYNTDNRSVDLLLHSNHPLHVTTAVPNVVPLAMRLKYLALALNAASAHWSRVGFVILGNKFTPEPEHLVAGSTNSADGKPCMVNALRITINPGEGHINGELVLVNNRQ